MSKDNPYYDAYLREKKARKSAEKILEDISRNLFEVNERLTFVNKNLEKTVEVRTAEISIAKDKAERLAKVKSEFLSMMSHEIKTPLNAILGYTQLLQAEDISDDTQKYASNILGSCEMLLGVIEDILVYSKIESGKLEVNNVSFDLSLELENLFTMFDLELLNKNVSLIRHIKEMDFNIFSDKQKILQILMNLLGNAVKFTNEGEVVIKLDYKFIKKDRVLLSVRVSDTGIGMPSDRVQKLFEPFVQIKEGHDYVYEGTGLGLSITRKLLKILGGEVTVQSKLGEGSVFSFWFETDITEKKALSTTVNNKTESSNSSFVTNKKVLVVEDNKINQDLILRVLKKYGVNADIVSNGLDAVNKAKDSIGYYDIILMDLRMPVMDGFEATKRIKSLDGGDKTSIIALSANELSVEDNSLLSIFDGFIKKPFKISDLKSILKD